MEQELMNFFNIPVIPYRFEVMINLILQFIPVNSGRQV